jgi:ADP-ribose pyrophosphatase YjhB (NUDIX family)
MTYCSSCGQKMTLKWVEQDHRNRHVCERCGFTHYQNPRVIVACAVHWRNKVLMCRRAQEPARGQWAVPTGFLESGESLEQAAARETAEETGLIIAPEALELCSVVNMTTIDQVAIMFRVELEAEPVLVPGPECLEVAFLAEEEIPIELFAWRGTMGDGPQRFFKEIASGQFTIQLITLGAMDGTGFRSREYRIHSIHETRQSMGYEETKGLDTDKSLRTGR